MRPLYVLLAGFGFMLGLPVAIAAFAWDATPRRMSYAYIGDAPVETSIDAQMYASMSAPFVGAFLGFLVAAILARFGWKLSRR
ncbi:MAG: hypothetical protein GX610_13020 [Rhodococcus sp.]|nr:hypothetical protein [Rhodococcus sp. (in: high G+C Gram-positive bacteria)]